MMPSALAAKSLTMKFQVDNYFINSHQVKMSLLFVEVETEREEHKKTVPKVQASSAQLRVVQDATDR